MTRRNQGKFSQHNYRRDNHKQQLTQKLDVRKLEYFNYNAREILNSTEVDERVWRPLLASIVTKARRLGIEDAMEYIHKQGDEDVLSKETVKALTRLLDNYKRWR